MQRFAIALTLLLLSFGVAHAEMTFQVAEEANLFSQDGYIFNVVELGFGETDFFVVDDGGFWRIWAAREPGSLWDVVEPAQYVVPTATISQGQQWNSIGEGPGTTVTAEVIGLESVVTGAGTFEAWKVKQTLTGAPAGLYRYMYFAEDVGLILEEEFENDELVWKSSLESMSVSGTGLFPMVVGNTWNFVQTGVETGAASVGDIKTRY